jgi:hypothetical protein
MATEATPQPSYSEVTLPDVMKYFVHGYRAPIGMKLNRYEYWIDTAQNKVMLKIHWVPVVELEPPHYDG